EYTVPLTHLSGTVNVPASVFAAGGGIYGVGIQQSATKLTIGEFASFRVEGGSFVTRPPAPVLKAGADSTSGFGHLANLTRAASTFTVKWNAGGSGGAAGATSVTAPPSTAPTGAVLEISAP